MIENIDLTKAPHSCGVYFFKDVNGEIIYVGSSNNLYKRMSKHKSCIKKGMNNDRNKDLYYFLQTNQFIVEYQFTENYRQQEQKLIERHNPKFNQYRAFTGISYNGNGVEYRKAHHIKYKENDKKYYKTHKEELRQQSKYYDNQLCIYNGEILTLCALAWRFRKLGISHSKIEAKKYLITTN